MGIIVKVSRLETYEASMTTQYSSEWTLIDAKKRIYL
jgi:hypothetical protein